MMVRRRGGEGEGTEDRRGQSPGWGFLFRRLKTGAVLGWLAVLALLLKLVGARFIPAGQSIDTVTNQVDSLKTRVTAVETKASLAAENSAISVYLSCEVLKAVTKDSHPILPIQCR